MRLNSIRLKMMLPIIFLALVLVGIFLFMQLITAMENRAMKKQTGQYFEAVTEVLNADRDIYQARLAQEENMSGMGTIEENRATFLENANQVKTRFESYRSYLSDEPNLISPFTGFEALYERWIVASNNIEVSVIADREVVKQFEVLDESFYKLRNMLDVAGEKLRDRAADSSNITRDTLDSYVEAISEVLNADRDLYQARLAQQKMINGVGEFEANKREFEENAFQALKRFQAYKTILSSQSEFITPYKDFDDIFTYWFNHSEELMQSPHRENKIAKQNNLVESDKYFTEIRDLLDKAGEAVRMHARLVQDETAKDIKQFQNIAISIIVVAFLVAFGFGYFMPKRITNNVTSISKRIKEISEGDGDLTARINSTSKDELGDLANEFDLFVKRLQTIMSTIQDKSHHLGSSTSQLSSVANDIKRLTQGLATSSESIVSAGSEMNMSNQQMAGVAIETADIATNSSKLTDQGIHVVNSAHSAIDTLVNEIGVTMSRAEELKQSSDDISSVLEVIRGIAEQTNLLALNAAIEAARAGEYGRGFAVVADEVRKLATQTSESTNQIESMISQLDSNVNGSFEAIKSSRDNADKTVTIFAEVTSIFDELSGAFNRVKDSADHTAQATKEQAHVANEIHVNMTSMKEQTDGVNTVSEQINQQAKLLAQLFKEMDNQVGSFKV